MGARPQPAELVRNVARAVAEIDPRTLLDVRAGSRYLATVAAEVVKLQAGLALRALAPASGAGTGRGGRVRSAA